MHVVSRSTYEEMSTEELGSLLDDIGRNVPTERGDAIILLIDEILSERKSKGVPVQ